LDSCTTSDDLIRIDTANWLLFVEGGNDPSDIWDAGGTTDKDELIDVSLLRLGITEDLDRVEGALEEVVT